MNKRYLLFIALAIFSLNSLLAPISWTGLGMAGVWEDTDNWSLMRVPQAGDDVTINGSFTVTVSSNPTIEALILSSGANLTIAATYTLNVQNNGSDGVDLSNAGTTLSVDGTLNTSGHTASGIDIDKFCSLTVSSTGIISVSNVGGDGIELSDMMSNAGSIIITNHAKAGIFGGSNAPTDTPISNSGSITISGGIYGIDLSNKFIMTNNGTITLSNASTALIDDGTNLDHFGTLKGNGLVLNGDGNDVVFKTGSIIEPGTSVGTLTFFEEVEFTDVTVNIEIDGAMDFDKIIVNDGPSTDGDVTLSNTTLNLSGSYVPVGGEEFMLFEKVAAGPITGTFNGFPDGGTIMFGGASFTISYSGGTGGNDMVMINDAPLPIELIDFNAQAMEDEVKIAWTTATETNNDFFTIERSVDGRSFKAMATIAGNGNTTEISKYYYMDKNPKRGISYYRLKQTDYDGQFSYSDIETVDFGIDETIKVYPTIVSDVVFVETGNDLNGELTIVIRDMTGREYDSFIISTKSNREEISLRDLNPGSYLISIYNNNTVETHKFIKL